MDPSPVPTPRGPAQSNGYLEEAKVYRKFGQMFKVNKNWNADIFRHHSRSKKRFWWLFRLHEMFSCLEEPPEHSNTAWDGQRIPWLMPLDGSWWVRVLFAWSIFDLEINCLEDSSINHHGVDWIHIRVKQSVRRMCSIMRPKIAQLFALWRHLWSTFSHSIWLSVRKVENHLTVFLK